MDSSHKNLIYCVILALLILLCLQVFKSENDNLEIISYSSDSPHPSIVSEAIKLEQRSHTHQLLDEKSKHKVTAHENLVKVVNSPTRVNLFDFTQCSMTNCFDFSRCRTNETIGVYIVPRSPERPTNYSEIGESNIIHANIMKIIRNSKYHQPDPEKACLRILEDDTLDRDPLSKSFKMNLPNLLTPEHQYGLNYLVFNLYSGSWPDYRENDFSDFNIGAAILAKASNSWTNHRVNFDISIPLFSHMHPVHNWNQTTARGILARPYLLTFKGKRYVYGYNSETRNSLYHLNNDRDVILLTTCRHGKKWRESTDERCMQDDSIYNRFDFVDLMIKSKFCLTPRGRRLGSFRYLEAMSYGCIPVIMSDGWVKPFDEIIDWSEAVVQHDEDSILLVPDMLRDISNKSITTMHDSISKIYEKYFSTTEKIILTTLEIINLRVKQHLAEQDRSM